MRLTPLDIREQQFRRVMRGLDPEEVETFLGAVAGEFEVLVAQNNEMRSRVADLEEKIQEYRSMEKALRDTLLTAEKVMGDAKENAQREAALILREAEMSAQRAKARLSQDILEMRNELVELRRVKDAYLTRVRWLLRSHLDLIEGHAQDFDEIDAAHGVGSAPQALVPPPASARQAPVPRHETASPGRPGAGGMSRPEPSYDPPPHVATPEAEVPEHENLLPPEDLADVMRPVGPDGSYDPPPPSQHHPLRPLTESQPQPRPTPVQAPQPGDAGWSMQRFREGLGPRP